MSIKKCLEFMVDNTKTVYLDMDFEKLSTKKEPGSREIKVSKEIYDAMVLIEKEYDKVMNEV